MRTKVFWDRLKSNIKEYKWNLLALCIIAGVLWSFTLQKEGYHMDELLSYELSNAEYNPWIVPTQPEGRLAKFVHEEIDADSFSRTLSNIFAVIKDVVQNRGSSLLATYKAEVYEEPVWIDRQTFSDYITVDKTDSFNYLSVYFNVKDDNHPPLHYMLLHTVSSLFRGQAAPFMGGLINLAAILGICILLMKIAELLWQDKRYGIMAALLYGLSSAAVATQLLIRMYGLMTFFCVAALYLHLKKEKEESFQHNKTLILVTVSGFLTQYFFLFYILILAAVTAFRLLRNKKGQALFWYMRSMATAAVIGLICFPFAISDVFKSSRGTEVLEKLGGGFAEYGERLLAFGKIVIERSFGGIFGILLILCAVAVALLFNREKRKEAHTGYAVMLLLPAAGYFLLAAKLSPYLVDRYVMAVFPFMALLLTMAFVRLKMPGVCMAVVATGFFVRLFFYDGEYLYKGYAFQEKTAESYAEYPCICIYEGSGYYENLIEFTKYKKTLLVTPAELSQRSADEVLEAGEPVVALIKGGLEEAQIKEILEEKYGYHMESVLVSESVYGDRIYLFTP